MTNENSQTSGVVIGNIILVDGEESGNLLAYRQIGETSNLVAAFPNTEQGVVIATLFAGYLTEMFPEGEITQAAVNAKFMEEGGLTAEQLAERDNIALAEINRLNLLGGRVEIKH